jgi:hypothetical protein
LLEAPIVNSDDALEKAKEEEMAEWLLVMAVEEANPAT